MDVDSLIVEDQILVDERVNKFTFERRMAQSFELRCVLLLVRLCRRVFHASWDQEIDFVSPRSKS